MSDLELYQSLLVEQKEQLTNLENKRKMILEDFLQEHSVLDMKIKEAKIRKEEIEKQIEELQEKLEKHKHVNNNASNNFLSHLLRHYLLLESVKMKKLSTLLILLAPNLAYAQATNPTVSQATIQQTICVAGWTKQVRPPTSFTRKIKIRWASRLGQAPAKFELDHIIPLTLGGAPKAESNLQLQLWPEAKKKDVLERSLSRQVCQGKISLKAGQEKIKSWKGK